MKISFGSGNAIALPFGLIVKPRCIAVMFFMFVMMIEFG